MCKKVLAHEKTTEVKTIIFDSIQDLYEDLLSYQSFIVSADIYCDEKPIIEGSTIYRHIELHHGHLHFHGNKFGGSELIILGNLLYMQKINCYNVHLSEYWLVIEGYKEIFIFLACKKSQR